jgi:hypothetical protein
MACHDLGNHCGLMEKAWQAMPLRKQDASLAPKMQINLRQSIEQRRKTL